MGMGSYENCKGLNALYTAERKGGNVTKSRIKLGATQRVVLSNWIEPDLLHTEYDLLMQGVMGDNL